MVPVQVEGFAARYMAKGYTSCWGDVPPPDSFTTFNSRTFLQAELHQATPSPTYAAGRDDDQARLAWRRAPHGSRAHLRWAVLLMTLPSLADHQGLHPLRQG
jgi:hypothetical protein